MGDVFRHKYKALSGQAIGGYVFHGVTAILSLWMLIRAIGGSA